jgi:hypothetical protein
MTTHHSACTMSGRSALVSPKPHSGAGCTPAQHSGHSATVWVSHATARASSPPKPHRGAGHPPPCISSAVLYTVSTLHSSISIWRGTLLHFSTPHHGHAHTSGCHSSTGPSSTPSQAPQPQILIHSLVLCRRLGMWSSSPSFGTCSS